MNSNNNTDCSKYTLGISCGYHDSSATLVLGGKVLSAALEEKFTRQKHDSNFPTYAVKFCLENAGIGIKDIGSIVYHEDPQEKFSRILCSSLGSFPHSRQEFVNSMKTWASKKIWIVNSISKKLGVHPKNVRTLDHHLSHAANAFMGSNFADAGILVVDAVGEWASTALYKGEWRDGKPFIRKLSQVNFPHSLGLVYSAVTAYLGFNPNDSECSTMALAAFGDPIYKDEFRKIIQVNGQMNRMNKDNDESGSYWVDQSYFNFCEFYKGACTEKFHQLFGPPRHYLDPLPFDCLASHEERKMFEKSNVGKSEKRYADVAASLQAVFEETLLKLANHLYIQSNSQNLCMAGGSAMNCVANGKLLRSSPFKNLFIPIDPGDGGSSLGAALYVDALESSSKVNLTTQYGPYLGKSYNEKIEMEMVEHLTPAKFKKFVKRGTKINLGKKWEQQYFEDQEKLVQEVSKQLYEGKVVGWFQSGFEWGARALGNRSLLIRPDDYQLAKKLSSQIKERAPFRPYSLSMTDCDAEKILDADEIYFERFKWMQIAVPVRAEVREKVKAGIHVDQTTRPQITYQSDNQLFYQLLKAYGKLSGLEVLLNTSFNEKGYPMVASPVMAMLMFARTEMDILVINNLLIRK